MHRYVAILILLAGAGSAAGQVSNPLMSTPWSRDFLRNTGAPGALGDLGVSALAQTVLDDTTTLAAAGTLQQDQLIDIRWHGAAPGGGDDTAAFTAACTAAMASGGIVFVPAGTWHITGGLTTTLTGDLGIVGAPGSIIDYTGGEFIFLADEADAAITLAAAVGRKAVSIEVDDTASLAAGDLLYITTTVVAETSWNTGKMEVHEIQAVTDATHLELAEPLVFSYDPADAGLAIKGYHRRKLCVEGLTLTHGANQFQVHYTIGTTIRNVRLINTTAGGNNCLFTYNINGLWDGIRMSGATYGISQGCNRHTIFRNIYARDTALHPIATSMWSYHTLVDGLIGQKVAGICDAHPSFETHYRNVFGYDTGFGNLRGIGGSLVHARIHSAHTNPHALMSTVLLTVDTGYHAEATCTLDDVHMDCPNADANDTYWGFQFGARVVIRNFEQLCRGGRGGGWFDFYSDGGATRVKDVAVSDSRLQRLSCWQAEKFVVSNCHFQSATALYADDVALWAGTNLTGLQVSNCAFVDFNAVLDYTTSNARLQFANCRLTDCNNLADLASGTPYTSWTGCVFNNVAHVAASAGDIANTLANARFTDCEFMGTTPAMLQGTVAWDPANLADGAGETSAGITIAGAALGDYVLVAAPYDLQDCTVTGYVQAANTVEIRLQNESTGARDLANGTWRARVVRK